MPKCAPQHLILTVESIFHLPLTYSSSEKARLVRITIIVRAVCNKPSVTSGTHQEQMSSTSGNFCKLRICPNNIM
jgi:hypothetical protein